MNQNVNRTWKSKWLGGCHCENIKVEFHSNKSLGDPWVRECPCSFCRKQGTRNVADPEGKLRVIVENDAEVIRYRMGHKTSDRLICRVCGVYFGGFMVHNDKSVCNLNLNVLERREEFPQPTAINVSDQTPEERIFGRLNRWMPFEFDSESLQDFGKIDFSK